MPDIRHAGLILESIGDGVITTDAAGLIDYMNPAARELTGWGREEVAGHPFREALRIVDEVTREELTDPVAFCLTEGRSFILDGHAVSIGRGEKEAVICASAAPLRDPDGAIIGVAVVIHNAGGIRQMTRELSWQATHDGLTGLINRIEFERLLQQALHQTAERGATHTLLVLDLYHFKVINDSCGHVAGDALLQLTGDLLRQHIRGSDAIARLGGDEFAVLLEHCNADQAMRLSRELLAAISGSGFTWEEQRFETGASVGLVEMTADIGEVSQVMSAADVACHAARDLGRDRVYVYQRDDGDLARRYKEMRWVSRIGQAIQEGRFILYRQLISSMRGDVDHHYEILIRMRDENDLLVMPGTFLPAAERYDLMPAIDRWVIENTFASFARCMRKDRALGMLSINLSGASLVHDDMLDYIRDRLRHHEVPPERICFEVTETAAIANLANASRFMRVLRKIGCRFSLDDFGSGLSSFAYLKNLPVDYLKIDGSFVRDIARDPVDRTMVAAITRVGRAMGLRTIAEFVENEETLVILKEIGVDYSQGFFLGKPEPLHREGLRPAKPRRP